MADDTQTTFRVMTEILVQAPTAEAAVDAVVGDLDYLLRCDTPLVAYNTLDAREFVEEDEDSTWQEWRDDPVRAAVRYFNGPRCVEHHPDCPTCHAWTAYDQLKGAKR